MTTNEASGAPWLLLIHQLPAKPAYARVKVWRRLQALGAVTVKGAVYALPANAETQEDFAWLAKEIVESGGEAIVCEAALVDGLSDGELQALFESARDEDYQTIAAEARDLAARLADDLPDNALAEIAGQVARLRKQLDTVVAIDFFGADGREPADGLVSGLEARLQREDTAVNTERTDGGPAAIGEIIHDIDLKDGKYGREEAAGIRTLIAGIASSHNDDNQRLERGGAVFDDLHRSFADKRDDK